MFVNLSLPQGLNKRPSDEMAIWFHHRREFKSWVLWPFLEECDYCFPSELIWVKAWAAKWVHFSILGGPGVPPWLCKGSNGTTISQWFRRPNMQVTALSSVHLDRGKDRCSSDHGQRILVLGLCANTKAGIHMACPCLPRAVPSAPCVSGTQISSHLSGRQWSGQEGRPVWRLECCEHFRNFEPI